MLTTFARRLAAGLLVGVASWFLRLGLTPNGITLVGFGLVVAIAAIIALGQEALAGVLLVGALLFDAVDGSAARLAGRVSPFGAFLDSTLDRWAEASLYMALVLRAQLREDALLTLLIFAALAGSLLVSYTRARAEALGVECKEGLLTRLERMALLILALLFSPFWGGLSLDLGIGLIAVLAHATALQRVWLVYRALSVR